MKRYYSKALRTIATLQEKANVAERSLAIQQGRTAEVEAELAKRPMDQTSRGRAPSRTALVVGIAVLVVLIALFVWLVLPAVAP